VRVALAQGQGLLREGLRRLIGREPDFEVVGEADSAAAAEEMVRQRRPDVLLLDPQLPGGSGLDVASRLLEIASSLKILVLVDSVDRKLSVEAMKAGAVGVLSTGVRTELLLKSVRKVHEGEIWLDAETTAVIMREFSAPGGAAADANEPNLSKREREIVSLVAQGLKNREIADKMFISEQTVKNHLHNIFDKVGVSDRLELALFAVQHKIRPE